jgi:hypothetical protein
VPDVALALKDDCCPTVTQDGQTIAAEQIRTMAEATAAGLATAVAVLRWRPAESM